MLTNGSLMLVQFNCRSLNAKLGEVKLFLYTQKPDIMCLSETWIRRHEPRFIGYSTVWRHRLTPTVGGGLGFLIRRGVQYLELRLVPFTGGHLEVQAIQLFASGGSLSVLSVYNPNAPVTAAELQHYVSQLAPVMLLWGTLMPVPLCWSLSALGQTTPAESWRPSCCTLLLSSSLQWTSLPTWMWPQVPGRVWICASLLPTWLSTPQWLSPMISAVITFRWLPLLH